MSEPSLREIIGDPKRLDAELQQFSKDAKLLSSQYTHLRKKYPNRWVAVFGGEVRADAESLDHLLARMDALQIPRGKAVVRHMSQTTRRMIL